MWTWDLESGWLRSPVAEVAELGLDLSLLPRWHTLVAHLDDVTHAEGGVWGRGHVPVRGVTIPTRWSVSRGRSAAHLTLVDAEGGALDLDVVVAPWNGGTMVELGASGGRFGGRRLRRARLHRALRRSLQGLALLVERPLEPAPVTPHVGLAPTGAAPA